MLHFPSGVVVYPKKMCVGTLLSPRAQLPPSGQFYTSCSGYKQKYSTHLFKTLPHAQQTQGTHFLGCLNSIKISKTILLNLIGLVVVWQILFGRFHLVGLVLYVWFGKFGLVGLVW